MTDRQYNWAYVISFIICIAVLMIGAALTAPKLRQLSAPAIQIVLVLLLLLLITPSKASAQKAPMPKQVTNEWSSVIGSNPPLRTVIVGPAKGVSTNCVIEVQSRSITGGAWTPLGRLTNSAFEFVGTTGGRLFRGFVIGEFATVQWDSALPAPVRCQVMNFGTNIADVLSADRVARIYSTSRSNRISAYHFDPYGSFKQSTNTPSVIWTNRVGKPVKLIIR